MSTRKSAGLGRVAHTYSLPQWIVDEVGEYCREKGYVQGRFVEIAIEEKLKREKGND